MSDVWQLSAQSTRFVMGRIPQGTLVKNGKNRKLSKFVNHNVAKTINLCVWNVNKLTEAQTKMEVGKLWTRATQ